LKKEINNDMKKKFLKIMSGLAMIAAGIAISSCNSKSLTDIGLSTNAVNDLLPNPLFTSIVSSLSNGSNGNLGQGMQYVAYYKDVPDIGGKQYNYLGGPGFGVYTGKWNQIKQLDAVLTSPNDVNKKAINKIIRVWSIQTVTDALGDIPYSEAMKGSEGNFRPKYDTQKEVYNQMFAELEAACNSFDASKPSYGTADVVYKGDINKWKKFGYTLMLRLAMHLSKADPATGKIWAAKALTGGVMTADADVAVYTKFSATFTNGRAPYGEYSSTQDGDNSQGGKMATTFINHLKATKDPRLAVIAVVWKKVSTGVYTADTNAAVQKGMIPGGVFGKPTNFDTFSEYSPLWWNREGAPSMILSPAEAYLLTSEAIVRGWWATGTAKEAYDNGVKAAMRFWRTYPAVSNGGFTFTGNITDAQINSYLLNGYPYNASATQADQIKQIITQRWVSLIGDDLEVWTNWRRTGYPVLKFKNWSGTSGVEGNLAYPGSVTGGEMFRRMPYPDERATNNDNQVAALTRQGFPATVNGTQTDALLAKMWIDKP
jgi:hypothetical protein